MQLLNPTHTVEGDVGGETRDVGCDAEWMPFCGGIKSGAMDAPREGRGRNTDGELENERLGYGRHCTCYADD